MGNSSLSISRLGRSRFVFLFSFIIKFTSIFSNILGSPLVSNQQDNIQLAVLLDFFEKIARTNSVGLDMHSSPMIVHCSAGIGRSGATIAIDIVLNRIRAESFDTEIEIPGLIAHIRSQRSGKIDLSFLNRSIIFLNHLGLVQTERQYEFIYRVIEYFVEQHMKPYSNTAVDYINMR